MWEALLTIPYGETRTYGEIAQQIGSPTAFRAVGLANGHNPIGIIVPCHRVIGSNGSLTGYGGGIDGKGRCWTWRKAAPRPHYSIEECNKECLCPPNCCLGGRGFNLCSAVSYFSTRVG